jgi:hypothetical protein
MASFLSLSLFVSLSKFLYLFVAPALSLFVIFFSSLIASALLFRLLTFFSSLCPFLSLYLYLVYSSPLRYLSIVSLCLSMCMMFYSSNIMFRWCFFSALKM